MCWRFCARPNWLNTGSQSSKSLTAKQIAAGDGGRAGFSPVEVPPEGSTLPQTYEFERGMTREAILGRARAAMDKELATEKWASRMPNLPRWPHRAIC